MNPQIFEAEWDTEGVFFYQAYNNKIADYALAHQQLGGPHFNPTRMTWIKPSFAWVLYRSGYAKKHNQERILKIKLSHHAVSGRLDLLSKEDVQSHFIFIAELLSQCQCKKGGGGSLGRVQWDPARDILTSENNGKEPRKILSKRAIQIGLKEKLSVFFVENILSIEDVTELAHEVGETHACKDMDMELLVAKLPNERAYVPQCSEDVLKSLGLLPGDTADNIAKLGKGKAFHT